jgi:D-alanine-D-alanine ligase
VTTATLNVAVLMGGPSTEAEVSRVSAGEVASGLSLAGYAVTLMELDTTTASALLELDPDVVFPALHGPPGEDGTVQGFLEMLGYPYVGSDVHGSAIAMDKSLAKAVFRRESLSVSDDLVVNAGADLDHAEAEIRQALGERVVIKPLAQGSAIGVTRVANSADLRAALHHALAQNYALLVEPYLLGREITVGVLDLHGSEPTALPVIEIRTASDEWYDYRNRYTAGKSEHIIPAPLSDQLNAELQAMAVSAHTALGLRDLSRADYIVTDANEIALLEVNTLPGMTPTSLFPDAAQAIGMDFSSVVDALVQSAYRRGTR